MIKKIILLFFCILVCSCANLEFVLDERPHNKLKYKTQIIDNGGANEYFNSELFSYFGKVEKKDYILITNFFEKKANRVVKNNQVAEKVDYELDVKYELFYKNFSCKVFKKNIVTKFSFAPKSSGYNFGTDRSLERLYKNSVKKNIENFLNDAPIKTSCIK